MCYTASPELTDEAVVRRVGALQNRLLRAESLAPTKHDQRDVPDRPQIGCRWQLLVTEPFGATVRGEGARARPTELDGFAGVGEPLAILRDVRTPSPEGPVRTASDLRRRLATLQKHCDSGRDDRLGPAEAPPVGSKQGREHVVG